MVLFCHTFVVSEWGKRYIGYLIRNGHPGHTFVESFHIPKVPNLHQGLCGVRAHYDLAKVFNLVKMRNEYSFRKRRYFLIFDRDRGQNNKEAMEQKSLTADFVSWNKCCILCIFCFKQEWSILSITHDCYHPWYTL